MDDYVVVHRQLSIVQQTPIMIRYTKPSNRLAIECLGDRLIQR
jgi:hypothetical protein